MTLPLIVSVPHAGWRVPPEVAGLNQLTEDQILEDGDVGSREIYAIAEEVSVYVTTEIGRAFVDMNRAADDRRRDGVVKTHTCWNIPVYREPLDEPRVQELLRRYYHPYHAKLARAAESGARLGIDLHTMAAKGPPVGPDPEAERPAACLSNADDACPQPWIEALRDALQDELGHDVRINDPFQGGYITRSHGREMPWLQLELNRAPFSTNEEKRGCVLRALAAFCRQEL